MARGFDIIKIDGLVGPLRLTSLIRKDYNKPIVSSET